jgi:hypothetical protein
VPAAASFLRNIPQPHSSKQMTVIQPPGVQWVVSLLKLKLGYSCDIFTPRVQPKETNFLGIHVDDRSESSSTYDMIMGRDLLGELGIIMNFNDHTVTWDTDTIPMKDRDNSTLSSVEALIEMLFI